MPDSPNLSLQAVGSLFRDEGARLLVDAAGLAQPVGDGGFVPPSAEVEATGVPLQLFGQAASLDASAGATVSIHPAAARVADLFVEGESFTAPGGTALASLDVRGELGLGTSVPPLSTGALTLSVTGSATAGFRYRHLLPVARADTRANALARLAATSDLPQLVSPDHLVPGEVHRLDALLNLSLGLEARWGRELDIEGVLQLWDGLAAPVRAHVAATLQATLGWSLYEEMQLTVGRANLLDPERVRIRLHRVHENRFTLGAVARLMVHYDASSVAAIVQQTLDQSPLPRLVDALRPVAQGDWDAIRGTLTDRAAATLDELLDDTGWKEWAAGSDDVADLVDLANTVVGAYDGLGERLQSLWDRLLGNVELAPGQRLHDALATVADLEETPITELVDDPRLDEVLDLFQTLAGESVEDLLLKSSPDAAAAVAEAADLAQRALRFLTSVPEDAKETIDAYAEKLGISGTLTWLRDNATSKQALIAAAEDAAQKRIRQLVELLVGKAWDRISDDDLAAVERWAAGLLERLDALQVRLGEVLARFEGELGVTLSLTLDRLTRNEALLDLEIDPRDPKLAAAIPQALLGGRVRGILEALPDLTDDERPPGYMLRQCVLSHRRVRTNSLSVVFDFLGLKSLHRTQSQWAEESNLTIAQEADGFRRSGRYAGGLLRVSTAEAESEGAVWLEIEADDAGAERPLARFAAEAIRPRLSVSYSYHDPKTREDEQAALDHLLAGLGFMPRDTSRDSVRNRLDGATAEVRFALTLKIGEAGVHELLAALDDEARWNRDYLRAAKHWYVDPPQPTTHLGAPLGPGLADLVSRDDFREAWARGPRALTDWAAATRKREVTVDGEVRRWTLTRDLPGGPPGDTVPQLQTRWLPPFSSLLLLSVNRPRGLEAFGELGETLATATSAGTQEQLLSAARAAARALKRAHPGDLTVSWESPLFLPWLVLVRLSPASRNAVRGVATLRWKQPGQGHDWNGPAIWKTRAVPPL